jgi:cell division protease FtsH
MRCGPRVATLFPCRFAEESHQQVLALLEQNRSKLDSLASALLEHETLDEEDAYAAAGVPRRTTPSADSYAPAARSRVDR